MPEKSGIDDVPCTPPLAGPAAGPAVCPEAGTAAAANVTNKRKSHRCKFMIPFLSRFGAQFSDKATPCLCAWKGPLCPLLAHLPSHCRRPQRLLTEGTPAAGVTPSATNCRMSAIYIVGVRYSSKFFRGGRKSWRQFMTQSYRHFSEIRLIRSRERDSGVVFMSVFGADNFHSAKPRQSNPGR